MKIRYVLFMMLFVSVGLLRAQDNSKSKIPLIGDDAPSFIAETTNGELNFPSDFGRSWKIIFSHPRDFTPVCSSEILELAQMQDQFDKIGTKIVVVSTDELEKHKLWKSQLEELSYKDRDPVKIKFPLIEDNKMSVSRMYGMLHEPVSNSKDVRGVFIIDPQNKISAIFFYPMSIGRNMEEIKRTVIALQTAGKGKDHLLTPANWTVGQDLMVPQYPYTSKQLEADPTLKDKYYNVGSFMWFKKAEPVAAAIVK